MVELETPYFIVRPAVPPRAGVVVIQEGDGITPWLLRMTERIALEGYVVAAPDLFYRTGGPGASSDLRAQGSAVQQDEALGDLAAARVALRAAGATSVGVVGFCMGGTYAWRAAVHDDAFAAAIGFYGVGIDAELGTPHCPTLLFFGARDVWIPTEKIDAVVAHHPHTIVYDDAGHAFMRDGSEDHVPAVAADAWSRTLDHFAEHLR
jgi:carboxymethylenebutenolidase